MTKDSTKPATKKDLQKVKIDLRAELQEVKTDLQGVKTELQAEMKNFATKTELQEAVKKLLSMMYTKQDHEQFLEDNRKIQYEHLTRMDEIMTEMRDMREERILFSRQFLRMDDTVNHHEKRICVLEKTQ